jgi:hypothetical protein
VQGNRLEPRRPTGTGEDVAEGAQGIHGLRADAAGTERRERGAHLVGKAHEPFFLAREKIGSRPRRGDVGQVGGKARCAVGRVRPPLG